MWKKWLSKSLLSAAIILSTLPSAAVDAAMVLTRETKGPEPLGLHYGYLEDTEGSLSIEGILGDIKKLSFSPIRAEQPNFGYSHSSFWLKADIDHRSDRVDEWYLEVPFPTLDHIDAYLVDRDNAAILYRASTGDLRPFSERPLPNRNFVFPLAFPPDARLSIYLRIESKGSLTAPSFLWRPTEFFHHDRNAYIAFSLYFGVLASLFVYNFLLYMSLRDRAYLFYILCVGFMALGQGGWNGLWFEYLWPDMPAWANVSAIAGFDGAGMFGGIFSRVFLDTKRVAPRFDKAIIVCIAMFGVLLTTIPAIPYQVNAVATSFTGVAFSVIVVLSGAVSMSRGFTPARTFILAWAMLLIGTAALGARNLGWIPTNFYTRYSMLIGSGLEMLLLSFALAERIKELSRAKDEAMRESHEARRIMIESLERSERELEEKVKERTKELSATLDDLRKTQAELSVTRDQAIAASKSKSIFLANMSHEIRTPMNGILGMAELLLEADLSPDQRQRVETLHKSGETLLTLLNDILDFSKIEAGKLVLEKADFDLHGIIRDLDALFSEMGKKKGLSLHMHIDPDIPRLLLGDGHRLRQILVNLLSNALKFTEKGEVRLKALMEKGEALRIRFEVEDTGIGIPAERMEDLFHPFTQADSSTTRKFGGSGLGLSIAGKLVEMMDGEIQAERRADGGSKFTVTVPFEASAEKTEEEKAREVESPATQKAFPTGSKILLVEDDSVNQLVFMGMLKNWGLEAEWAENGLIALNKLKQKEYDLVFMDCNMPEMDGYAACRAFREYEKSRGDGRRTPIMALTAFAMKGDKEKCLAAGMDDYMVKPLRGRELKAGLARWLGFTPVASEETPGKRAAIRDEVFREIQKEMGEQGVFIFRHFLENLPGRIDTIRRAVEEKNAQDLAHAAHSLKGTGFTLGLDALGELAAKLEKIGEENRLEDAEKLLDFLETTASQVMEKIKTNFLDQE